MKAPGKIFLQVSGTAYIILGSLFALSFFSMLVEEIDLAVMLGLFSGYLFFVGIMGVKFCRNTGKTAMFLYVLGISMAILMGAGIIWIIIDERIRMFAALGALVSLVSFLILLVFSVLFFVGAARNKLAYKRGRKMENEKTNLST